MGKGEREVERYLGEQIRKRSGFTRKYISPGHKGVPDQICFLPGALVLFVEVKTNSGTTSKLQLREIKRMKAMGALAVVVFGKSGINKLMEEVDGYLRRFAGDTRNKEQEAEVDAAS